jgi:hypothetical protein
VWRDYLGLTDAELEEIKGQCPHRFEDEWWMHCLWFRSEGGVWLGQSLRAPLVMGLSPRAARCQSKLGRSLDRPSRARWLRALGGGMAPGQVAAALPRSVEWERDLVNGLSHSMLHHAAAAATLQAEVSRLRHGASVRAGHCRPPDGRLNIGLRRSGASAGCWQRADGKKLSSVD